jgi:hypothetical protein
MFEIHSWSEGRSSKLHSVCRESAHKILICAVQNCTVCAENLCTKFLFAQFKTAQFVQRIHARNSYLHSSKLHSVCRESTHKILICAVQNCTICAENPRTKFLFAQFKTAQCVQRIYAQNSYLRSSKLHSLCRESVHIILNRTVQNCRFCEESRGLDSPVELSN